MPFLDGTGPLGCGPMTGGGRGYCAMYLGPYAPRTWIGRGLGFRGFFWGGRGRGWRHWYYATGLPGWMRWSYGYPPVAPVGSREEASILKEEAQLMRQYLEHIERRVQELEKDAGTGTGSQ
ncbi:MAG: DUF5320 domain-containing protein [Candidatus Caldatribacteriaceae bacterium]